MESVQPLRISKSFGTPEVIRASRPLSEIGISSPRLNSSSFNLPGKRTSNASDTSKTEDGLNRPGKPSIRDFWSSKESAGFGRFDENTPERSPSPAPLAAKRRPSVEKLMQASRVKNSNMFALENRDAYDPSSTPVVERPSANRPLSESITQNSFARLDSINKEARPAQASTPKAAGSKIVTETFPILSPSRIALPSSPVKQSSPSPPKSSLVRNSQFTATRQEIEHSATCSTDAVESSQQQQPRILRRHAKSVTFHEDPPEVNEYEEETPEPSLSIASERDGSWDSDEYYEQDYSYEREESSDQPIEDSFDADLENAEKTPVVLPEDWSRMSPSDARTDLVDEADNVFDNDDELTRKVQVPRPDSRTASDGESRPLPPLPDARSNISAEPTHNPQELTPLKRASCSKADILNSARASTLTSHERLSMLSTTQWTSAHNESGTISDVVTFKNLDTGKTTDVDITQSSTAQVAQDVADLAAPPRISRESILRKVRNTKYDFDDEDDDEEVEHDEAMDTTGRQVGDAARPTLSELAMMHPDDPVPSRENSCESGNARPAEEPVPLRDDDLVLGIKQEEIDGDAIDLSAIPDYHGEEISEYDRQGSVLHHSIRYDSIDDESQYSDSMMPDGESTPTALRSKSFGFEDEEGREALHDAMQLLTMADYAASAEQPDDKEPDSASRHLPTYLDDHDFTSSFADYLAAGTGADSMTELSRLASYFETGISSDNHEQDGANQEESGGVAETIAEPLKESELADTDGLHEPSASQESDLYQPQWQEVPERKATIKTNGRLKARPSGSAADFTFLSEQAQCDQDYPVPPIPQAYLGELVSDDREGSRTSSGSAKSKADSLIDHPSLLKRDSLTALDLDILPTRDGQQDELGLVAEFDKVIEGQKRGYVMREATKVVIASNRNVSGDSNGTKVSSDSQISVDKSHSCSSYQQTEAARKVSGEQHLKTEPWNGTTRRKSTRNAHLHTGTHEAHQLASNAIAEVFSKDVARNDRSSELDVERGRLFVKVASIRDLDLPLPQNNRLFFQLTLDNGLHCVTTADIELGQNAPIGQEFELVVLNDLEFQLTLTTKLPSPPKMPAATSLPAMSSTTKQSRSGKSGLSRFLTSPKKRAEKERQEREAAEAEERRLKEESRRQRAIVRHSPWDKLHDLVNAADGSFARAYVNLQSHEEQCFGRQLAVSVPCYNEWALERDAAIMASVRSKRGANTGPVRRPPYVVGHLELQLLYIPKPANASDEDMPQSMNAAIREMNKASEMKVVNHEGFLSQQGGDCVHWRRRFFRLQGPRLTAYHEHTNQKRAVINLSKASRLVDDRSTLVADPKSNGSKSKTRRKSAFAEEDEGYQYVEEGFRLRFANGETIDFYADSRAMKDEWMSALSQVIGKQDLGRRAATWTDLVLAHEQSNQKTGNQASSHHGHPSQLTGLSSTLDASEVASQAVISVTVEPGDSRALERKLLPISAAAPRDSAETPRVSLIRAQTPPLSSRSGPRSRSAVKSMIF